MGVFYSNPFTKCMCLWRCFIFSLSFIVIATCILSHKHWWDL